MRSVFRLTALAFTVWYAALPSAACQDSTFFRLRTLADSLYGLDDLLVNGVQHIPGHPRAEGHPFFPSLEFSEGVVFVKGERFDQVKLNYDAEDDRLILDVSPSMPWIRHLAVNELLVDSFRVGNHLFVHVQTLPAQLEGAVYLEKLYEGRFVLLAQRRKSFKAEFSQWKPYGEYISHPVRRLILQDGAFFDVSRKKQWLDFFSAHRKELKKFLQQHKIHFRKATTGQLKQVAAFCNGL